MLDKIDDLVDELYYEIMVGPEAFEVMPLVKVVLDRLAVSCINCRSSARMFVCVRVFFFYRPIVSAVC